MAGGQPFRALPIYIRNKKVAEITESSVKFMRNGEQQIGFDEVLGESHGVVTTEFSFTTVEPSAPKSVDMDALLIEQAYFDIGLLKNGITYKVPFCMMSEAETKSTSKSGVQTGTYSARGGKPQRI